MSRQAHDNYPTDPRLARATCHRLREDPSLGVIAPRRIIEPSAGSGTFVAAARATWPAAHITAVDIRDTRRPCVTAGADAFNREDWSRWIRRNPPPEAVLGLGNPPFSLAEAHVRAALQYFPEGSLLAFLLRLGFLGSELRVPFWAELPARWLLPIVPRPSFGCARNDNSEYGIFVWQAGFRGLTQICSTLRWR